MTDASLITTFRPAEVWTAGEKAFNSTHKAKFVSVHPFTAIAVGFWGTDANNEAADAEIIGFMFPDSKNGPGPGTQLWKGTITLSANVWGASDQPHPQWPSAAYVTPDLLASTYDIASVTLAEDSANGAITALLLLPTLGFSHLACQITDINTMATLGVLWKGISKEGVL